MRVKEWVREWVGGSLFFWGFTEVEVMRYTEGMKQFSPTKPITKKNLEKVPKDMPGVYRIRNSSDKVLFIGTALSRHLDDRIWEHRGKFQKGTKFQFRTMPNSDAVRELEKQEIRKHIASRSRRK